MNEIIDFCDCIKFLETGNIKSKCFIMGIVTAGSHYFVFALATFYEV